MELYPGWSARDNYGYGSKKKKRKKDRSPADSGGTITLIIKLILKSTFIFVFKLILYILCSVISFSKKKTKQSKIETNNRNLINYKQLKTKMIDERKII